MADTSESEVTDEGLRVSADDESPTDYVLYKTLSAEERLQSKKRYADWEQRRTANHDESGKEESRSDAQDLTESTSTSQSDADQGDSSIVTAHHAPLPPDTLDPEKLKEVIEKTLMQLPPSLLQDIDARNAQTAPEEIEVTPPGVFEVANRPAPAIPPPPLPPLLELAGQPTFQPSETDGPEVERIARPLSAETPANKEPGPVDSSQMIQDIALIAQKLRKPRANLSKRRNVVAEARKAATKQRRQARLAQKRLLGGQIDPQSRTLKVQADEAIARLNDEAKAMTRKSRLCDEKLDKAEKLLRNLEAQIAKLEGELYAKLDQLNTPLGISKDDDEDDGSMASIGNSTRPASVASLDEHPLVSSYNHLVGAINILRDRLNDFEINHRQAIADREDAFEDMIAQHKGSAEQKRLDPGAETHFVREHYEQNKRFLQAYFDERRRLSDDLLKSIAAARDLRQQCLDEGLEPEDPDDPNAIEEALRYNLEGAIGTMYAVKHEGKHRGIMPISLIGVPYEHGDDRVERWLQEVHIHNVNTTKEELDERVKRAPLFRSFEINYDVLKCDEARLNPFLTSATEYKPSHMVEAEDVEEIFTKHGPVTLFKEMRHWTAWAGEVYISESEPDFGFRDPDTLDHAQHSVHPLTNHTFGTRKNVRALDFDINVVAGRVLSALLPSRNNPTF